MLNLGPTFIWTIFNLILLYIVLKRILFKPVTQFMENRTKSIKESIDKAEKDMAEAEELKREYDEKLKTAHIQADKIIDEARSRANGEYNNIVGNARKDAENIVARAREEIQLERERMLRDIKDEVASLALAAASKVLEANVDNEENRKLVDKFIDEAGAA